MSRCDCTGTDGDHVEVRFACRYLLCTCLHLLQRSGRQLVPRCVMAAPLRLTPALYLATPSICGTYGAPGTIEPEAAATTTITTTICSYHQDEPPWSCLTKPARSIGRCVEEGVCASISSTITTITTRTAQRKKSLWCGGTGTPATLARRHRRWFCCC